jgi:hypothetical protein
MWQIDQLLAHLRAETPVVEGSVMWQYITMNRVMGRIFVSMKLVVTGWKKVWGSDGKGKVHPRTGHECPGGGLEV